MDGALPVLITPLLILAMLVLTVVMCIAAALAAILPVAFSTGLSSGA
jgi:hypothetical protein